MNEVKTWDETYQQIARVVSKRSKDPRTQVGAVIVSYTNRVLSLGYNGTPVHMDDETFPWDTDEKYDYVVHAERNAILNYRGSFDDFVGSTIYITHFPCPECAKEIAQTRLGRVVYEHEGRLSDKDKEITRKILGKYVVLTKKNTVW